MVRSCVPQAPPDSYLFWTGSLAAAPRTYARTQALGTVSPSQYPHSCPVQVKEAFIWALSCMAFHMVPASSWCPPHMVPVSHGTLPHLVSTSYGTHLILYLPHMVPTFARYSSFCGAAASLSSSRVLPTAMCPEPEPYHLVIEVPRDTPGVSVLAYHASR